MAWKKGQSGNPKGRKPGTQNKTTRAVKEFLAELVDKPNVQAAIEQRIEAGDTASFFKALEHVVGKPKQAVELSGNVGWYVLPDGDDVADSDELVDVGVERE
jgi:hypothetical protein